MTRRIDEEIIEATDELKVDVDLTHQIVHGDDNTVVETEGGGVPSHAKVAKDTSTTIVGMLEPSVADINEHAAFVSEKADDAEANATGAANSASAAATSESNASDSASAAAQSATTAAESEVNAGESATSASSSASSAGQSASSAATSESNAADSEMAAASSATAAVTSESNASDSETAALASEQKAHQWAEEDQDVPVEGDEYSAYHWAKVAEQHAGTVTNGMYFAGSWDMADGLPPEPEGSLVPWYRVIATPEEPEKISVELIAQHPQWASLVDEANPGDQLCWDPISVEWFLIDTTDQVWSVNGQLGDVNLTAEDVGASTPADVEAIQEDLDTHKSAENPHGITPSKIGADTSEEVDAKITEAIAAIPEPDYPVDSVNGKTGAVNLSSSDVGAAPEGVVETLQEEMLVVQEEVSTAQTDIDDHKAAENPHGIVVPPPGRINLLINGDFRIWQRGNPVSNEAGSSIYTADRWLVYSDVSGTASKEEFSNGDYGVTLSFSSNSSFNQYIEYPVTMDEVTVSFNVVHATEGTRQVLNAVWVDNRRNIIGEVSEEEVTSGDGDKVVTISVPEREDGALHLAIGLVTVGNHEFTLMKFQCSEGSTEYPFERIQIAEEFAICQRYYSNNHGLFSHEAFSLGVEVPTGGYPADLVSLPVAMRVPPTATIRSQIGGSPNTPGYVTCVLGASPGDYVVDSGLTSTHSITLVPISAAWPVGLYWYFWEADAEI